VILHQKFIQNNISPMSEQGRKTRGKMKFFSKRNWGCLCVQ